MCKKLVWMFFAVLVLGLANCVLAIEADAEIPAAGDQKPVLDGVVDDVWLLSTEQLMEIHLDGDPPDSPEDCSGSWRALWDSEYLYVLVNVVDESLVQDSTADSGWDDDRIEIFVDGDNSKDEETDQINDYQYCFRWNYATVEVPVEWYFRDSGINKLEGIEYAVATVQGGYLFEIALPWSTMIGKAQRAGQLIGIDVVVDDDDDGTGRDSQISWYNETIPPHSPVNWGTAFLVPEFPEKAFNPNPLDGQTEVPRDSLLSWEEGIYADKHNVYFGMVPEDVNNASVDDPGGVLANLEQEATAYDPGILDFGTIYYWRVDEVNDVNPDSPWKGELWSFTVANFIVVEDFEDYNDYPPDEIWNTWIDGYGDPSNGSTAGYPDPDFNAGEHYVETSIVHSGSQSMPLFYNNAAGLSEVSRSLSGSVSDWTREGVVTLAMFYYGDAANAAEPMYVAVNGNNIVANSDLNAALVTEWTRFDVPLAEFANQGANLANINSLSLGFGNKANPIAGGSGVVYFDDIRLYRP